MVASLAEKLPFKGGIIDPYNCLEKYAVAGKEIYFSSFSDTHWTQDGNEIVGRALADHISENWLKLKQSTKFSDCSDKELQPKKKNPSTDASASIYQTWLQKQS
ncbi:MAG: hypothetical protein HN835_05460 [Rhodobiaceae bacterium]|nr:hypothetical protein [Rhodobiaceae bacterium]